MATVEGPFTQTKFLGATVHGFTSSIGWNEQQTVITVTLYEDKGQGDSFRPPEVGRVVKFKFDAFQYEGILQKSSERGDINGNPAFEVIITDPREVLAGAQVIISSFNGKVSAVPNLINAYGHWESSLGFGGSLVNESGMVWQAPFDILGLDVTASGASITVTPMGPVGIKPAIEALTVGSGGYGAGLQLRGETYSVDLSGLPLPPPHYRIGGVSVSILDAVSQVCQDGGHDFIIYLENGVIKVKTVSRVAQPSIGDIANFINSQENVISKSVGQELRNDITNSILLGGDLQELVQVYNPSGNDTIWPYWGEDPDGNAIIGVGTPEVWHEVLLNASPIADIMGSLEYHCTIPELRCALMDFDSWAAYVIRWYPDKAKIIDLVSAIDSTSDLTMMFPDIMFQHDLIAQRDEEAYYFGRMNESEYWTQRAQRVYDFVRNYAQEYFGKKFLVRIPFLIYWKYEPETTHLVSTDEISDAGYTGEGAIPLGLAYENNDYFLTPDGRFECFIRVPFDPKIDWAKLDPDSVAVQSDGVYVKATAEPKIIYPGGSLFPYCVVTLSQPVHLASSDPLGGVKDIATLLDVPVGQVVSAAAMRYGSFPMRIHPAPIRPDAVAIPMKNNRVSYGPWWTSGGVPGKVNFQRDESMVPWNYGDWDTMNKAAEAKLANSATEMQVSEAGSVELAGSPTIQLGDSLVAGGPNVTGITVSVSDRGVSTQYSMQTFTPRFGTFSKDNADRLRRLGLAAQDIRRSIRALFLKRNQINRLVRTAELGFMQNTSKAVRQHTPHDVLYGSMAWSDAWGYRTRVAAATPPEVIANLRGDVKEVWESSAAMGYEGLLRPFSTNWDEPGPSPGTGDMPHYQGIADDSGVNASKTPCRKTLDPFGDYNDIDLMVWGEEYPKSIHTLKSIADPDLDDPEYDKARLIGLRGPMVLVGWGYEYTGKPFPNEGDTFDEDEKEYSPIQDWKDTFIDKHRSLVDKWKAGPVDLRWDNWRKVWTVPTVLFGTIDEDVDPDKTVKMTIDINGKRKDKIEVLNWLGGKLKKGTRIKADYYPMENRWIITSARC